MASCVLIPGKTNWGSNASWEGGATPVDGDDVFAYEGSQIVDAGLSQGSINLNSLYVGPDFLGSIGSDSNPLAINVDGGSTNKLTWASRGRGYCKISGTIPLADVFGSGTFYASGGTFAKVNVSESGRVIFDPSCEITASTGRIVVSSEGASVYIPAKTGGGTTTCALAIATAGRIESARTILTAQVGRYEGIGRLTLLEAAAVSTLLEMHGGFVRPLSSGVITLLQAWAGDLDPEGNRYGDLTITNAVIAASAKIKTKYTSGKIVFSNTPTYSGPPSGFDV